MAILESLRLGVVVKVDSEEVIEYPDPDPNPQLDDAVDPDKTGIQSTYIEAQDDKEFVISCKIMRSGRREPADYGLAFRIYVDGKYTNGIMATSQDLNSSPWSCDVAGVHQDLPEQDCSLLHKFRFSTVTTVDEAAKAELKEDLKTARGLGTIVVKVCRIVPVGRSSSANDAPSGKPLTLAEKALKGQAISHGTAYSPPTPARMSRRTRVEDLDNRVPIAIFTFKYRSRAALQSEMIVRRSPSHTPTIESAVDGLSVEELRRIARERLQEIKLAKQVKREDRGVIKRDFDEFFDLTDEAAVPQIRKVFRTRERVEVDLTDD